MTCIEKDRRIAELEADLARARRYEDEEGELAVRLRVERDEAVDALLPVGSVILTPDEQETIRQALERMLVIGRALGVEKHVGELEAALALLGGDKTSQRALKQSEGDLAAAQRSATAAGAFYDAAMRDLAAARQERDELRDGLKLQTDAWADEMELREEADARVARLEQTLTRIAADHSVPDSVREFAREALAGGDTAL